MSQGYDFRVVVHKHNIFNWFDYWKVKQEIRPEIKLELNQEMLLQNVLLKTKTMIFVKWVHKVWKRVKIFWKNINLKVMEIKKLMPVLKTKIYLHKVFDDCNVAAMLIAGAH